MLFQELLKLNSEENSGVKLQVHSSLIASCSKLMNVSLSQVSDDAFLFIFAILIAVVYELGSTNRKFR